MDGGGRIAPGAAIENNAGAIVESDAGSQGRSCRWTRQSSGQGWRLLRVLIWLFPFHILASAVYKVDTTFFNFLCRSGVANTRYTSLNSREPYRQDIFRG
jgi:hypothetical protein